MAFKSCLGSFWSYLCYLNKTFLLLGIVLVPFMRLIYFWASSLKYLVEPFFIFGLVLSWPKKASSCLSSDPFLESCQKMPQLSFNMIPCKRPLRASYLSTADE